MKMVKVMIIEDLAITVKGICSDLKPEQGFEIIAVARDEKSALSYCQKPINPDLFLVDIQLPDGNGLDFIEKAKLLFPQAKFVILSLYEDLAYFQKALELKVDGYISKRESSLDDLPQHLKNVTLRRDFRYFSPRMQNKFIEVITSIKNKDEDYEGLSRREKEILHCLAADICEDEEIALELAKRDKAKNPRSTRTITRATIKTHLGHIREKLGKHNKAQLIIYAKSHMLIKKD